MRAIYDWVRRNFYFISDPVSKENLRTAPELLRLADLGLGSGDCDDMARTPGSLIYRKLGHERKDISGDRLHGYICRSVDDFFFDSRSFHLSRCHRSCFRHLLFPSVEDSPKAPHASA